MDPVIHPSPSLAVLGLLQPCPALVGAKDQILGPRACAAKVLFPTESPPQHFTRALNTSVHSVYRTSYLNKETAKLKKKQSTPPCRKLYALIFVITGCYGSAEVEPLSPAQEELAQEETSQMRFQDQELTR